jgi:hypothetical protein
MLVTLGLEKVKITTRVADSKQNTETGNILHRHVIVNKATDVIFRRSSGLFCIIIL